MMKKIMGILMALVLLVCACGALAESETFPQPEGGRKFESDWAIAGGLVNIVYEEEGYRVFIELEKPEAGTGSRYEYSCYYNEGQDALVSVSSSRRDYTTDERLEHVDGEPLYDGMDEENQVTVFTIDENGCLCWKDGHDDAGAGLKFASIGRFTGLWRNEQEEVEAEFLWNGLDPDSMFYTVYIQRGKMDGEQYASFLMNGFFDPATGKLQASGTCIQYTRNADGGYDMLEDGESYDAVFSMLENGNLCYETANGIELEFDPMGSQG